MMVNALTTDVVRKLRGMNYPTTHAAAELIEAQELEIVALIDSVAYWQQMYRDDG